MTDLKTALQGTGFDFAYAAWAKSPSGEWGTYIEDSGEDLTDGSGIHIESGTYFTVDYFTHSASEAKSKIEAALNTVGPWTLEAVQYESDTRLVHFSWRVGVYG